MKNEDSKFNFKKKYGQNFLTNKNLLNALCESAKVDDKTDVLEIGVGKGALTESLVLYAKKVVGYEIDKTLKSFLEEKFFNQKNLTLIFKDVLKENIAEIEKNFDDNYSIVANIPYYITTPLIFKFMEESKKCVSQALMVQKEVAERIVAKPSSDNYGALSVICQHFNTCKILRYISKKMFRPMPKVDSAFILLKKNKDFDFDYSYLVRSSFSMRRKTLINNLLKAYSLSRQQLTDIFENLNFDLKVRAENLLESDFSALLLQIKTKLSK